MSQSTLEINHNLSNYLCYITKNDNSALNKLRIETLLDKNSNWMIPTEEAQLIKFLLPTINAKRTLEIGVYTGYSTLVTALSLPKDGKIIACDISDNWLPIAQKYWKMAKVNKKIFFIKDEAITTLNKLIKKHRKFDFIFIDADKLSYDLYYELSLKLINKKGVILIDNTLWHGKVTNSIINDKETKAIRNLNTKIKNDKRVTFALIPMADGITLVRKR